MRENKKQNLPQKQTKSTTNPINCKLRHSNKTTTTIQKKNWEKKSRQDALKQM